MSKITIGTDVEFFAFNRDLHRIVSAEGMVPGTKAAPYKFTDNPYFATQLDNVLAEGNIPPATSADEFVENIATLKFHLDEVLMEHRCHTVAQAAHRFNPDQLTTEWAKTFGCDPSFDAWTGELVEVHPFDPCLRSAGFHIHIGYPHVSMDFNRRIVRAMDLYLGVPSVILDPLGKMRRDGGYGQSGNFRHQKWGVEYRTLSSHLAKSPALVRWVYENTLLAYKQAENGFVEMNPVLRGGTLIRSCIDASDAASARSIVSEFRVPMPPGGVS